MSNINWQNELALGSGEVFEPEPQEEDQQEQDRRLSGSFAEGQERLSRAIRYATELVERHLDKETN